MSIKGLFNGAGNMAGGYVGKQFSLDLPVGRTIGGEGFYNFVGQISGNVAGNLPATIEKIKNKGVC